jgi:uncharacterized protein
VRPHLKCYAYLDIETTGLSWDRCDLTVVGVARVRGGDVQVGQLVGERIDAEGVLSLLEGADEVYTYNGSRFDLPFIRRRLDLDLKRCLRHTDLMYDCWRQNLKGGPAGHRATADGGGRLHGGAAVVGLRQQRQHASPAHPAGV